MNTSFYPIEMSTMGSPRNHDNESYDWACESHPENLNIALDSEALYFLKEDD
jgi:hypothetical protein